VAVAEQEEKRTMAGNRGDHYDVRGGITNSQGIAMGRGARADVAGNVNSRAGAADVQAIEAALADLHAAIADAGIPASQRIRAQTAVGTALEQGLKGGQPVPDVLASNVQKAADLLRQADTAVQEGSALWRSVQRLAPVLGPLVKGGSQVVAGWWGVPLPG
jgi:hypothetical protein